MIALKNPKNVFFATVYNFYNILNYKYIDYK